MATLIFLSVILSKKWVGEVSPIPQMVSVPLPVSTPTENRTPTLLPSPKIYSELPPIFKKISWCESKNRQFNSDGTVHRGVQNPQDVGKYQINEHYHLEASKALGIDIYTLEGNTRYAFMLYTSNGTRDWNWSKGCWDDQTISTSTWAIRFKQNL